MRCTGSPAAAAAPILLKSVDDRDAGAGFLFSEAWVYAAAWVRPDLRRICRRPGWRRDLAQRRMTFFPPGCAG